MTFAVKLTTFLGFSLLWPGASPTTDPEGPGPAHHPRGVPGPENPSKVTSDRKHREFNSLSHEREVKPHLL